jgi:hypothetical protein
MKENRNLPQHDAAAAARLALMRPHKRRLAKLLVAKGERRRSLICVSLASSIALSSIAFLLE